MAKQPACTVTIQAGRGHKWRAVAFLDYQSVGFVDICEAFLGLDENEQKHFKTSFDYWISGFNKPDRYHGWNKSGFSGKYQECFVFKNPPHRLYGFLCHPREPDDKRFQTCVLILHAQKKKWTTDTTELDRAETMRQNAFVQTALRETNFAEEVK